MPIRFPLLTLAAVLTLLVGSGAQSLVAMPPPTEAMLKQYRADGSLAERRAFAEAIGNHRTDPQVLQNAHARLLHAVGASEATAATPPSAWRGLPTVGSPKMFILLIDFSDYPADPVNTVAAVTARAFGSGDGVQAAPYESLNAYYARSSYNQLHITGNVLATYRPAYTRASMGTSVAARQALIQEAITAQVAKGHDFSQYDNNNSGKIDYFAVLWTGPDTGWSSFWWAYQTGWSNGTTPFTVAGKTLNKYVWQWVANAKYPTRNAPNFDPKVLIHETGHALGLPDYYDYDSAVGPLGGVGRLDIMDGNWGDHNCFSKFLLNWISPAVYTSAAPGLTLNAAGTNQANNAIIVMDSNPGGTFGEYFMVQNRQRLGNDANVSYPSDGLLVWHVDSRLDPATGNSNYLYDNSYTAHKLLRLMEADGLEEIETGSSHQANAGDYWLTGKDFGPASRASSNHYDGSVTRLGIKNISAAGPTMTLDVYQITDTTAPTGKPTAPTASTALDSMTFTWTQGSAADSDSGVVGYHLQVGTSPGAKDVYDSGVGNVLTATLTDLGLRDGVPLYATVAAMNGAGLLGAYSDSSLALAISLPSFDRSVVDNGNLVFKTLGPWTPDSTTYSAGTQSARSAVIADARRTYLQAGLAGPGALSFDWKVNSESGYDFLTFSIDGVDQSGAISGTVTAFASKSFQIPAGNHVVRWNYAKDAGTAPTGDGAWVDNIQWTGATAATATITPANWVGLTGSVLSFTGTLVNATANSMAWSVTGNAGSFAPTTTASGAATQFTAGSTAGSYLITATPADSPNVPGQASLSLVAASSVTVSVSASAQSVQPGVLITFTPSVSPLSNQAVTWSNDGGSWSGTPGATASWSSTLPGTYTITATSAVATSRSGAVTVTVQPPALLLSPASATLLPGAALAFTASNDQGHGVSWSLTGSASKVDSGLTSTVTVASAGPLTTNTCTLTATDLQTSTRTATATLTVKGMDLQADGVLDPRDLLVLASQWGRSSSSSANLKGSGGVDDTDLAALLLQIK